MLPTVGNTEKEKATKSMYKRSQEGKKRTRETAKEKARGESPKTKCKLCSLSCSIQS